MHTNPHLGSPTIANMEMSAISSFYELIIRRVIPVVSGDWVVNRYRIVGRTLNSHLTVRVVYGMRVFFDFKM